MDGDQLRGLGSRQLLQLILQCVSILIERYNLGWLVDEGHDVEFVQQDQQRPQEPQGQDPRRQHEPAGGPSFLDPHHDQKESPSAKKTCSGVFSAGVVNKGHHHDWQPQYNSYPSSSSFVVGPGGTTTFDNRNSTGTTQELLTPYMCNYTCRYCSKRCGRTKAGHSGHSCYEHRHRRD